jgi:FixJ family two-component response regulator
MLMHLVDEFHRRVKLLNWIERRILHRIVRGRTNFQISHELGLSLRAVKVHRKRVLEMIGIKSVLEMMRVARFARMKEELQGDERQDANL